MGNLKTIEKTKQLLVEGKSCELFIMKVLKEIKVSDIQVQDYGGINDLNSFLEVLSMQSIFKGAHLTIVTK